MNRAERRQIWKAGGPKVRWGQRPPFHSDTLLSFAEAKEINDAIRELEKPPTYALWYPTAPTAGGRLALVDVQAAAETALRGPTP